jgi:hypothetical protein
MELAVTFTDQVLDFGTSEGELRVLFRLQAAQYRLSTDKQCFGALVAILSEAWRTQQPIEVTVLGVTIVDVAELASSSPQCRK